MDICWPQVTCAPSHQAILALKRSWAWLVPEPWTPVLFSVLGDVFLQKEDGQIYWLNTGTGELALVADSTGHFESLLKTEIAVEWFIPSLVDELREAGKIASAGECYTYVVFPVFAEGGYDAENLNVVPATSISPYQGSCTPKSRMYPTAERFASCRRAPRITEARLPG